MSEKQENNFEKQYIDLICSIYGDSYDDREEDSRFGGLNWEPGRRAAHKSISAFQKELMEVHGIKLSRVKIQKILITGRRWTTERSREVQELYAQYTERIETGGREMKQTEAIRAIADHLGISSVTVSINLPYERVVYDLEEKSPNAKRIEKWRKGRTK